jgi:tRNA1Val (adenine37-N6)-methyltransferase
MANPWFDFKQFRIRQDRTPMKAATDAVLLGAWAPVTGVSRALDIGTGTGLLALMVAQRSGTIIDAIEIDPIACHKARENVERSPWKERISIFHASLQQYIHAHVREYDLIISNPPYYRDARKPDDFRKQVAKHDSSLSDETLLDGVEALLVPGGRFSLVLPAERARGFIHLAHEHRLYCHHTLEIIPRIGGRIRRILMEFAWTRQETVCNTLQIMDSEGNFTGEYRDLTHDFYLAF